MYQNYGQSPRATLSEYLSEVESQKAAFKASMGVPIPEPSLKWQTKGRPRPKYSQGRPAPGTRPRYSRPRTRSGGGVVAPSPGKALARQRPGAKLDLGKYVTLPTVPIEAKADKSVQNIVIIGVGILVVGVAVTAYIMNRKK